MTTAVQIAEPETIQHNTPNEEGVYAIMNLDELYGRKDAAKYVGLSFPHFRNHCNPKHAEHISGIEFGRTHLYTQRMLDAFKDGRFPVHPTEAEIDAVYDTHRAAEYVGMSVAALRQQYHAHNAVTGRTIGKVIVFLQRDLDLFLEERDGHKPGQSRALSDLQVEAIRLLARNGRSQVALADEYGVSKSLINKIVKGERYEDVGGPVDGRDY